MYGFWVFRLVWCIFGEPPPLWHFLLLSFHKLFYPFFDPIHSWIGILFVRKWLNKANRLRRVSFYWLKLFAGNHKSCVSRANMLLYHRTTQRNLYWANIIVDNVIKSIYELQDVSSGINPDCLELMIQCFVQPRNEYKDNSS